LSKEFAGLLIIDDDEDVLTAARLLLKRHFQSVVTLNEPGRIPQVLKDQKFDVILLDMNFSGGRSSGREGLDWLGRIIEIEPKAVVVPMTAYGDAQLAVDAIKLGASDFVLKPWQNDKLVATVSQAARLRRSQDEVNWLRQRQSELADEAPPDHFIAESPAMKKVLKLVAKAAPTDANILILGENGTGKELVARQVWRQSARCDEVFLGVDLGALPETLFESELFGHLKGAFTDAGKHRMGRFQAAAKGTLFLDEIGNLPPHSQAKLLRVLEQREVIPVGADQPVPVDVRLVCATNRDLEADAGSGEFRTDLLYRVNTVQIRIPPLRERREDIQPLIDAFLTRYANKYKLSHKGLTRNATRRLTEYHWPGNVRELEHAVERALILSEGEQLGVDDFFLAVRAADAAGQALSFDSLDLEDVERRVVEFVIAKHQGNISHAARELGITRTSLYRRIEKYGL
jgi:two-component system response regulator HydG